MPALPGVVSARAMVHIRQQGGCGQPWFAGKAVEAGTLLINETLVDDLIWQDGRVVGVRTGRGDGEAYAHVVIVAAGVNTLRHQ